MKNYLLIGSMAVMVPFFAGCGGDMTTGEDAGSAGVDMAFVAFKLDAGTYKNQTAVAVKDDCMMKLDDPTLAMPFVGTFSAPLTVNHTTGEVTFGNQDTRFATAQPSQGSGIIDNNEGVLTAMGVFTSSDTCSYNLVRTNTVTVTADNQFSSAFKEVRTSISTATCQLPTDCTSTFTLTYAIQ
jgi:hypothetical protein